MASEPPVAVRDFARREAVPYPVLSDPDRRLYAVFGLRRGRLTQLFTWSTFKSYLQGALHGRWPRLPQGDLAQLGGDFIIDPAGEIVFAHRSQDPADRPSVEAILAALRSVARTEPEERP